LPQRIKRIKNLPGTVRGGVGHVRFVSRQIGEMTYLLLVELLKSVKKRKLRTYFKLVFRVVLNMIGSGKHTLISQSEILQSIHSPNHEKLIRRISGLHQLHPQNEAFSYSILIPVYKPHPQYFETALKSTLNQTAPHFEVIIGCDGEQPQAVYDVVSRIQQEDPRAKEILKIHHCDRTKTGGGISRTTNEIAQLATGKYLLLMDHDDWIRPDLLYRYELTLRLNADPEKYVLYCNEFRINERDEAITGSYFTKPEKPEFPYFFLNTICHCLMVPRTLFHQLGGLRPKCDGAQDYDLCLRLDVAGAKFQNVPLFLYAWRAHDESTAKSLNAKDYATPAGIKALTDYIQSKGLDWKNPEMGVFATSYRASPNIPEKNQVQVVIPFKDQGEMTFKAIRSLQRQKLENFTIHITCVDNGSQDTSISEKLAQEGIEVFHAPGPFNYSSLNNLAVRQSRYQDSNLVLFMNNDVELEPDAVLEMVRWIGQPRIGIVGCRLHYPNGRLQHGGVELSHLCMSQEMGFGHTDAMATEEQMGFSRVLRITDALTAACLLVRRDLFNKVGGFDELWYPISYSDTDLARKFRRLGYLCLYTPFARGVHYESMTRGSMVQFEDMERSRWLFVQTENHRLGNSDFVPDSVYDYPRVHCLREVSHQVPS